MNHRVVEVGWGRRLARRLREHRAECWLALGALLLYVPAIGWGVPAATRPEFMHAWGPDDIAPLGPLAELRNTLVEPRADRYLAYPLMQHFLLLVAYGPYLLYLLATGALVHPRPTFPFGLADPAGTFRVLTLIARSVTVLMGAGVVVAAYQVGRALWGRASGVWAGIFTMLLYPMFYYSRTGNLDVPALFWSAAGMAVYARIVRQGYTVRRGIWLGVLAALSTGTKDQGVGLFVLMPLVLLPLHLGRTPPDGRERPDTPGRRWAARLGAPAATVVAGLLVYLISSGFVLRPERYVAHVRWITRTMPNSATYFGHPASWDGYVGLLHQVLTLLTNIMSGPLLALAVLGMVFVARRDRLALALLVPAIGLFATIILPTRYVEMRFLLPVGFILACFAAAPLGADPRAAGRITRAACVLLGLGACVLPLFRGVDLTHAMLRDSRYAAADWLNARLQPGDGLGFFGPESKLPPVRGDVELARAVGFRGTDRKVRYSATDIDAMADSLARQGSRFVLVIPDHSSSPDLPYGTTCPPELYGRLRDGSLGFRLTARFGTPPLLDWARRPPLDYPAVNPPVEIFARVERSARDGGAR